MKKFVAAYYTGFDNSISIEFVEAKNEIEAICTCLKLNDWEVKEVDYISEEEIFRINGIHDCTCSARECQ